MTNIVTWKWNDPKYAHPLKAEYYNILLAMLKRHVTIPDWKLIVLTDDTQGLSPEIEALPLPVTKADTARNPAGDRYPSCYRRLWTFSKEAGDLLGGRYLCIDVDVIIVRNIDNLLTREEKFVGWTDPQFRWKKIAGGLYFMQAGAHPEVYDDFDPKTSPQVARDAGYFGSDQSWISYKLYPPEGEFTRKDGVYYTKWTPMKATVLPEEVRILSTPGELKPWTINSHKRYPWISTHWKT